MNFIQGEIIAIDKPYGMSSFGALAHIRYLLSHHLGQKVKIGHAGTLDPLATGVLVLCTGKCTKQIEQLQSHIKEYTATLQLGATTVSYDMEHEVNETFPTAHINRDAIEKALQQFVGDIEQVPPTYSACKIDGKRSYNLRRKYSYRRDRSNGLRCRKDAGFYPCSMRKRNLYSSACTRLRSGFRQWRLSYSLATHTHWQLYGE